MMSGNVVGVDLLSEQGRIVLRLSSLDQVGDDGLRATATQATERRAADRGSLRELSFQGREASGPPLPSFARTAFRAGAGPAPMSKGR